MHIGTGSSPDLNKYQQMTVGFPSIPAVQAGRRSAPKRNQMSSHQQLSEAGLALQPWHCLSAPGAQIAFTGTAAQIPSQISTLNSGFLFSNTLFTYFNSLVFTQHVPSAAEASPTPSPWLFSLLHSSVVHGGCSRPGAAWSQPLFVPALRRQPQPAT